jgi:hypothetical protein
MKLVRASALTLVMCAVAAAQNAALIPVPKMQFFDNNGYPLAGGQIYTCVAGSSCPGTPLATYTDSSATPQSQNPNPVVLDAAGRASIWIGASAYKIVAEDATGNTLWTQDNVSSTAIATSGSLTGANGATLIGYTAAGTGATRRSVADKLGDYISLLDYGALCDGSTNDTTPFTKALAAAQAAGKPLYIPDGKTCLISAVSTSGNLILRGLGTLRLYSAAIYPTAYALVTVTGGAVDIDGPTFDQTGLSAPNWTDQVEPVSNAGYYFLRVNSSTNVNIHNVRFSNLQRGVMIYQSTGVNISGCYGFLTGVYAQSLFALDQVTDFTYQNNRFYGDKWLTTWPNYSVNGLFGWAVNKGLVVGNTWAGFQIVLRSVNPYVLPAGQAADLTFSDNTVDTPIADTALVGWYRVVATGNRIINSGDMGLTFDMSNFVTATGNTIEGSHVGGINIQGAYGVTVTGNVIRNIARAYSQWNTVRTPSTGGSWMSCITVSLNPPTLYTAQGVAITGNSCWMDVLPPVNDGFGAVRAKVVGIAVDPTTSTPQQVVVTGNTIYADETDMPGLFIQAATGYESYSALTGTPRVGELFTSSTGNQFRLISALSNTVFYRDAVGYPQGSEVFTGASSGATITISTTVTPGFMGTYLANNRDYISAASDATRALPVYSPGAFNTSYPTLPLGDVNTGFSSESNGAINVLTKTRGGFIRHYGLTVDRAVGGGFGGGSSIHDLTSDSGKGAGFYYLRCISSYLGSQSVDCFIDSNGVLSMPNIKATTGTRYICIDTTGKLTSSATACSGT